MKALYLLMVPLLCTLLLGSCIGTDIIDDPIVPEEVMITPRVDTLMVGETIQFSATYYNQFGNPEQANISWVSTNTLAVTIDNNGLATCLDTGSVMIIASVGTIADTLTINTSGVTNTTTLRMGTFVDGDANYKVNGTATLEDTGTELKLTTNDGFNMTAGPGIYLFLAKTNNGTYSYTPGSNVVNNLSAQITANKLNTFTGKMEYTVPAGVDINDYDFVVYYCVTVGGVFGWAELN